MHPIVKGVWALVSATYQVVRAQADLDDQIQALIDAMNDSCKVAKDYAPLNGRRLGSDSIVQDILKEVIKGANLVQLYCEKRPTSAYILEWGMSSTIS